jgi:hypothetical protein
LHNRFWQKLIRPFHDPVLSEIICLSSIEQWQLPKELHFPVVGIDQRYSTREMDIFSKQTEE